MINIVPSGNDLTRSITWSSIISCTFLVVVLILTLHNHIKLADLDPLSNRELTKLRTELHKSPKDGALKNRIRKADLKIRAEYFRRLTFATKGNFVLGFAAALAVFTTSLAISTRKKLPQEVHEIPRDDFSYRQRNLATIGSIVIAVLAVSALSVQALNRPADISDKYSMAIELAQKTAEEDRQTDSVAAGSESKSAQPSSQAAAPAPVSTISDTDKRPLPVLPIPPGIAGTVAKNEAVKNPTKKTEVETPVQSKTDDQKSKPTKITTVAFDPADYSPTKEEWIANWPAFRGPMGNGVVPSGQYPAKWNAALGENLIWKTDIPLPGWNSPIVWKDRIFLTGADQNQREIYCFSTDNGSLIWSKKLDTIDSSVNKPNVMEDTGYAPSTCVTDGKRVFAIFPNGDIFCLDYEGTIVWKKSLGLPENSYGHATSLVMYKSLVIVQLDQSSDPSAGKSMIYALQGKNGDFVWATPRNVPNSWTTPLIANEGQSDILVTAANPWTIAYDPLTGAEIWRASLISGEVAPSPAYWNGMVFVSNMGSYVGAIKTGGKGDVTKTNIVWKNSENLPDISSPVADSGLLFQVTTDGIFTCFDALTGKKQYEHPFDVTVNASPIIASGRVYLLDAQGTTHIISSSKEFVEESKGIVSDKTLATPAFAAGRLYIRGSKTLFCIGVKQ